MTQRIRRRQCGCVNDCFGRDIIPLEETLASMIEQNKACCAECEGSAAPCVYTVESACDFSVKYAGDSIPKIIIPKSSSGLFGNSMLLRKYCIGGCEYRAGVAVGQTPEESAYLAGQVPGEWFWFPNPTDLAPPEFKDPNHPRLCTIAENWWFPPELGYPYTAEEYQALIDRSTTWILQPIPESGGYWELKYVYPDAEGVTLSFPHNDTVTGSAPVRVGRPFRYVSVEPWKCLESNTVMLDEASQLIYPTAPKYLCVIPKPNLITDVGGSIAHLCETVSDQCACCDNGMCTGYSIIQIDCPDGLYEFPPFETKRYLPEDRLTAVDEIFTTGDPFSECLTGQPPVPAEIVSLVPDVDTVPCGIFYGTFAGGGTVWWCTGTEYNHILWCINPITEEATVIYNGPPSEFECRCDWYYFKLYFETPPECLQCPTTDPPIETECCPDNPIPTTLTVDVVVTGTTANAGSQSYEITYDSGMGDWRSDGSPGGACDDMILLCSGSSWNMQQQGTCDNATDFTKVVTLVSCDPFLITFTFTSTMSDVVVTGTISE